MWGFKYTRSKMPAPNKFYPNTKGLIHFKERIMIFFFFGVVIYIILYMPKTILSLRVAKTIKMK